MLERFFEDAAGDQRGLNVQQGLRIEYTAAHGQVRGHTDIMRAANGEVMGGKQVARFGRLGQEALGFFEVCSGLEGTRRFCRSGEITKARQTGEDLVIFEHVQSLEVHG